MQTTSPNSAPRASARAVLPLLAGVTLCLALVAGCSAGKEYDVAHKAESAGDASKAYDAYLKAAEKHPGDGGVIGGLKRTAPAAADFWESEAILAANEGRFDDAWRMWMRVLEIQPGHPTAPGVLRQLEQDHGSAIGLARADYLRGGSRTLARVEPSGRARTAPPRELDVIARAEPRSPLPFVEASSDGRAEPAVGPVPGPVKPEPEDRISELVDAEKAAEPAESAEPAKPVAAKPSSPTKPEADKSTSPRKATPPPAEPVRAKVERPAETPRQSPRSAAPAPTAAAKKTEPPSKSPAPRSASGTLPQAAEDVEYLAIRILSKKDRRYPQSAALVDGITVKLRDTDDDLEADLDLLDGRQRIKKVRDLPVGRSCAFRGRSGKYYQLTVLGVEHKTRTVRLGVRPV